MARIEVVMPQMGESITEGTIVKWHKKVGDQVKLDETLLEISTDKVDSEIPSPGAGVLAEIVVGEQQTVPVRTVIAYLESEATQGQPVPVGAPPAPAKTLSVPGETAQPVVPGETAPPVVPGGTAPPVVPGGTAPPVVPKIVHPEGRFYSPLVLSIARTEGLPLEELGRVPGSGEGGRVSKRDILAYLAQRRQTPEVKLQERPAPGSEAETPQAPPVAPPDASPGAPPDASPGAPPDASPGATPDASPGALPDASRGAPPDGTQASDVERIPMSVLVQKMAQHMVNSVRTSPHVAAVHEVDMTAVVRHRDMHAAEFERREGFKLTFTPYIVHAVSQALKKYPLMNSSIDGTTIIRKKSINIGLAVAAENGLIVPVIKNTGDQDITGIARSVHDLVERTRIRKLKPDEVQGGTFTISNYGVFGTLIGTPIINQPQIAILGTGMIQKRVVAIDDGIAIRSMAYFTMSFDHRVVDGNLGGMFLDQVVKNLQGIDPAMTI